MTGPAVPSNPKADLWDAFVKAGLPPDSATKSVNAASDAGLSNADAYDHFVLQKPLPATNTPGVDPTRAAQGFFDHLSDAVTFGQGKKALAAVQSLAAGHGLKDYGSNLAQTNKDLTDESAANHKTAIAGSVAGAVLSPINKVLAPLGVIGGGIAGGALAGSGASKDDLASQLTGAGLGAAGGLLVGGAAKGIGALLGPSSGERLVASAANDPGVKAKLAELTAAGRGPQAVLADLSPKLNGMLDRAANRNPDVMDQVQRVISGRQPDAAGRVMNDMTDAVGNPHLAQMAEQMKEARIAANQAAYGAVEQNSGALPKQPLIDAVSKHPAIMDVLRKGLLAGDIENAPQVVKGLFPEVQKAEESSKSIYQLLIDQGVPEAKAAATDPAGATAEAAKTTGGRDLRFRDVQNFAQELDDKVGSLFAGGKRNLALQYKDALGAVKGYLTTHAPGYAEADAQHAGMKANEEALQAGAAAWKNPSARDVAAEFGALTPAQQQLYRKGLASSAIDQLGNRNTNLDAAAPLTNASASTQQKLQLIFGDQPTFDKFMQGAQAERQLARLNSIAGGSATARRGAAEGGDAAGALVRGATSLAHGRGVVSTMMHTFAPSLVNGMRNQTAAQAGPLLTTQGPDAITQLLSKMQGSQQSMGLLTQGALGGANLTGGLLGQ